MIRADVTVWRGRMRAVIGATAIWMGLVGAPAAQPGTDVFSSGPDAFAYLHEVATHPRCMNCHGREDHGRLVPTVGDTMDPHPMSITARHNPAGMCPTLDEAARPRPLGALRCTSCHGRENAREAGGPPGAPHEEPRPEEPRHETLGWHMPTRPIARLWLGISRTELCQRWQAAMLERIETEAKCKKRGPEDRPELGPAFVHHIGADPLIAWAFNPGPGRTPAPGSVGRLEAAARKWTTWLASHSCRELDDERTPDRRARWTSPTARPTRRASRRRPPAPCP